LRVIATARLVLELSHLPLMLRECHANMSLDQLLCLLERSDALYDLWSLLAPEHDLYIGAFATMVQTARPLYADIPCAKLL